MQNFFGKVAEARADPTIGTALWQPDTCGCALEYYWESTQPQDKHEHKLLHVHTRCPAHAHVPDARIYDAVLEENRRKNIALSLAQQNTPTLVAKSAAPEGEVTDWKPGVRIAWEFDDARNLTLTISGLTTAKRKSLQSLADKQFGKAKVVFA